MECLICGSNSYYYFSKLYSEIPFKEFMSKIGRINYYKCSNCGFVLSKTHSELDKNIWSKLNFMFHHYTESKHCEKKGNPPPYAEQAMMLYFLGKNGIIKLDSILDYAAGYGTLSNILRKYFNIDLPIFDPYIQSGSSQRYIDATKLNKYKTVINSAMFEHVLQRKDLDHVNSIVDIDGCLIIHTVICENIPKDPNWFYLRPPVHTAFHTNKSMQILMDQWGYHSSLYCPQSKCWAIFKSSINNIETKIEQINRELIMDWFYYKKGFVDYWKGF